jgi:hypothetical protein
LLPDRIDGRVLRAIEDRTCAPMQEKEQLAPVEAEGVREMGLGLG